MSAKPSDVSTVIIVNKNQQGTKTLQIKTKHISRFRQYVLGVLGVIVCLSGTIVYLHKQNAKQELEKQQLMAQIVSLKGQIPVAKADDDKTSAQSYIQAIEDKLQKINGYLRKRGVPGFTNKSVGGSGNKDAVKLTDKEKYSMYDEYLSRLAKTVAYTPLGYPRVSSFTSFFGYRNDPFENGSAEFHPGIDFKGQKGDAVKCTANGTVVYAGWFGGYGNCVRIQHINSLETLYGHLSRIDVKVGQKVEMGDVVGRVGSTGHSTGTHLHYEVRKNGVPINPVKYLSINN
ncbi:peptidoglycan DD-metalloendopeptidase family protein [Mucilaginibacter mali]|uniref:Peptidoglycan DD-metalloendopeptidase family protein n=1 Tax=Mucilaginibacter mali TaxID=2740462 RepID=A0A7D4TPI3_9SPHI|nr:peptidoglycan DD-metalloendopeptidase family protein [Mucilaginibacter mali]QKJ31833.1 peptidoglycan DD-metalloendopeptidase family protein [Mucilaginibacter mali]